MMFDRVSIKVSISSTNRALVLLTNYEYLPVQSLHHLVGEHRDREPVLEDSERDERDQNRGREGEDGAVREGPQGIVERPTQGEGTQEPREPGVHVLVVVGPVDGSLSVGGSLVVAVGVGVVEVGLVVVGLAFLADDGLRGGGVFQASGSFGFVWK